MKTLHALHGLTDLYRRTKMPAHNWRFGVMAAVAPQKRQCEFGREYPAGTVVGAATTPSRWDVTCKPKETPKKCNE